MIGKIIGKVITAPVRAAALTIDAVDSATSWMAGTENIEASQPLHQACDEVEEMFDEEEG